MENIKAAITVSPSVSVRDLARPIDYPAVVTRRHHYVWQAVSTEDTSRSLLKNVPDSAERLRGSVGAKSL
jgi:hypothetical protein